MKTIKVVSVLAACIVAGAIFYSCQKEQTPNPVKEQGTLIYKAAVGALSFDDEVCLDVYGEEYDIDFTNPINANKNVAVRWTTTIPANTSSVTDDEWDNATQLVNYNGNTSVGAYATFTFEADELLAEGPGTYYFLYKLAGPGGSNGNYYGGYAVFYETCCSGESFSYSTLDNLSVIFTYKTDEDIPGAEVKLTCPHILGFTANDGKSYDVNNDGNVTVLTWTGDITACVEITFDLTFVADCDADHRLQANIWTDFKVNEVSKKTVTPPEVGADCEMVFDPELGEDVEVCSWPIIKYDCLEF